jgi:hypothetical protein
VTPATMPSGASPLRLGALCIGVEGYTHLSDVECAARDACALDVRINATPFGSSSFIRHSRATSTGPMLLRAIRTRLQELAEREDPPESFLFYYGAFSWRKKVTPASRRQCTKRMIPVPT